jgi:DNA-binding NarL/FixJ family response regulator
MKTLALIGNNVVLNLGLRQVIGESTEKFSIKESENLASFHQTQSSDTPTIIMLVVDTGKDGDDLEQITQALKWYPSAHIVIYDNILDLEKVPVYLRSEVQGYVTKKSALSEITKCLTTVQSGKRFLSNDVMDWVLNKFYYQQQPKSVKSHKKSNLNLTQHELMIARHLASGMKTSTIAQKIDRKLSTISTIKYNIFKKLNIDNVIDLKSVIESNIDAK